MAEKPSFYVADAEKIVEMVRLAEQDQFITDVVSGLLPPEVRPETIHHVLDIGCGPGGWSLELAKAYPAMQVRGIDISEIMIEYASKRAVAEGIDNVSFQVMDFQQLDFFDSLFDLVNARLLLWFLQQQIRNSVLQEWFRVVRRGRFVGTPLLLRPMLQSLGCQDIQERAHVVNFSTGTGEHAYVIDDIVRSMDTMTDFVLKSRVISRKKLMEAQEQVRRDIDASNFLGLLFFVSAWGRKPAESEV